MPRARSLLGLAVGVGYVVGTFPTASIVARRASGGTVDLRVAGTGNPGSANALTISAASLDPAVAADLESEIEVTEERR